MPAPHVPLPACEHDTAFAFLASALRRDPVLQRHVKTWRNWEGKATDGDAPNPQTCPFVRITPISQGIAQRFDNTTTFLPFTLLVELAVAGDQPLALQRLAAQVRRVLFPTDAVLAADWDAKCLAVGISRLSLQSSPVGVPYAPAANAEPAQLNWPMIAGQVRVVVDLYVQTQPTPT